MSSLVFPTLPGVDIKVTRAPYYQTATQTSISGKEWRSTWMTAPRCRYTLRLNFVRSSSTYNEFQKLFGFFARHLGPWDSFLWQDPEDYTVTAHPFGVGNGSKTTFQLQRTLVQSADLAAPASRYYWPAVGDGYEPVWEPNVATDAEYVNGSLTSVTHGANGAVTFAAAPASGAVLTWTGTYYQRVRFADDALSADRIVSQVWESQTVSFVSVLP